MLFCYARKERKALLYDVSKGAARGRIAVQEALQGRQASVQVFSLVDALDPGRFGLKRILAQASHDLFGTKDVQDVATASYVWLADQTGHLALGFIPTLALCWVWRLTIGSVLPEPAILLGYVVLAAAVFGFWVYKEREDIRASHDNAGKVFPFDSGDIVWNVKTALVYFGIGGAIALTAFAAPLLLLLVVPVALWPGFAVATWWLRRKLAFQQAGCPFLYRLANFTTSFEAGGEACKTAVEAMANLVDRKVPFWRVLFGQADAARASAITYSHILVTGPFRSGKTSLVVGIATEFAFALGAARYMAPDSLIEAMLTGTAAATPTEFNDGRVLWCGFRCKPPTHSDLMPPGVLI